MPASVLRQNPHHGASAFELSKDPVVNPETGTLYLHPDRNLGMELVRATEAAAIRAQRLSPGKKR